MCAEPPRAELEELEATSLASGEPRFLFATAGLGTALHALASEDEELARAAHGVCRRCKDVVCHVFEFAHDPLEALSYLACHGWPTPLVDLSASAAWARRSESLSVVDVAALPEHLLTCDSGFLSECEDLDVPPRLWLERRGVVLTHAEWRNYDTAADFALGDPSFEPALTARRGQGETGSKALGVGAALEPSFHRDLHDAIRKAGRKILGPAGGEAIEELIARLPGR